MQPVAALLCVAGVPCPGRPAGMTDAQWNLQATIDAGNGKCNFVCDTQGTFNYYPCQLLGMGPLDPWWASCSRNRLVM